MIDLFFRKFYTLWGSIMLVLPVSVCVAWFVITDGAESAEQARMMFMGSCRVFLGSAVLFRAAPCARQLAQHSHRCGDDVGGRQYARVFYHANMERMTCRIF